MIFSLQLSIIILFSCTLRMFHVKCEDAHTIKLEDIIVDFVNSMYFDEDTFDITINYNSGSVNTMRIRIDVIEDLPLDIFLKIKVWGRALGQYKVPTGISLDINVCDNALKKYFLDQIFQNIGVDMSLCPPPKGIYEKNDFNPDISGLPLYALPGFHVLAEVEVYSPKPSYVCLLKIRSFTHIY